MPSSGLGMAELGARVIKIERPGAGDFARGYDERVRGQSSHFVWTNRSKESLTLDLKQPEALDILMKLLESADVLVQNLAPGAAARMGLSFDTLWPLLIEGGLHFEFEDGCVLEFAAPAIVDVAPGHDYVLIVRPGLPEAVETRGFEWLQERVAEVLAKRAA